MVGFTTLMAIEFTMTESGLYANIETQPATTTATTSSTNSDGTLYGGDIYDLPSKAYNVLDYGLKGDGSTDDTGALNDLASNTGITNWYFPAGYTFRLSNISVPAHVDTLYGGGTIKTIMSSTNNRGAFHNTTTTNDHTLYDGLLFTWESNRIDTIYGAISYGNAHRNNNIEIRNCTFTGNTNASHNALLFVGDYATGALTNTWVHNNQFIKIPRASIEVLGRESGTSSNSKDDRSIANVNIYSNTFDASNANNYGHKDGWHCAISFSANRGGSKAYNNRFINHKWDVEVSDAKGCEVYNNYSTGTSEYFIFYNNREDGYDINVDNPIHHNHFESDDCMYGISIEGTAGGMPLGNIYENYIKGGPIWHKEGAGGRVHDNTIVKNLSVTTVGPYSAIIKGDAGNTTDIEIADNDIYVYGGNTEAISNRNSESSTSGTQALRNNIYTSGTGCISLSGATLTSNVCNTSWSGTIPTGRVGAGLLP